MPENQIFLIQFKFNQLNLEYSNQAKNIPVGLPSSPIKLVKRFTSYDRTYKQTNRDYYFIYIWIIYKEFIFANIPE